MILDDFTSRDHEPYQDHRLVTPPSWLKTLAFANRLMASHQVEIRASIGGTSNHGHVLIRIDGGDMWQLHGMTDAMDASQGARYGHLRLHRCPDGSWPHGATHSFPQGSVALHARSDPSGRVRAVGIGPDAFPYMKVGDQGTMAWEDRERDFDAVVVAMGGTRLIVRDGMVEVEDMGGRLRRTLYSRKTI